MQQLTQSFQVTLLQDVIFNATAATTGGQAVLDYLPGSVFLGAVAAQLYADLSAEEAWLLFHSGEFRFMDALPLVGSSPAWPIPLSWHHYKGEAVTRQKNRLEPTKIFDPALPGAPQDPQRQPKQMRQGYITSNGDWVKPALSQRMKTAIDQATGRAADAQLFGYQSLDAGQTYYFELKAPANQTKLFEKVVAQLTGQLRLGRSRSAQYGQVEITQMPKWELRPTQVKDDTILTLWLLSDLALTQQNGQPGLQPEPHLLGLPADTEWLASQSFIRTRSYSAFNAHRRCYDPERQVICRGSVLRYRLGQPLNENILAQLTSVGSFQEQGLGLVACNPALLANATPTFASTDHHYTASMKAVESDKNQTSIVDSVLISVLNARMRDATVAKKVAADSQHIFNQLLVALASARNWQGVNIHHPIEAPGRSQWGKIKELASQFRHDPAKLWQLLVTNNDAVFRERSGWELEINPTQKLYQLLTNESKDKPGLLVPYKSHPELAEVVGRLAVLCLTPQWQDTVNGTAKNDIGVVS